MTGELTDLIFTLLGKLGRWFNIQGRRSCFVIWSVVMVYWIWRDWELGLMVQTGGCVVSLGMHVYGYLVWKRKGIGE